MGCQLSAPLQVLDAAFVASSTQKLSPCNNKKIHMQHTHPQMFKSGQSNAIRIISSPSVVPTVCLEVDEEAAISIPKVDHNGNLLPEEVTRRTSTSLQNTTVTIGNREKGGKEIDVQYAYRSQRGYNADDPLKVNQDKCGITLNLAGETGDALFGVYDGHGEAGHHCATFAKKTLPQQLAKFVRQKRVQKYTSQLQSEGGGSKRVWNPKLWPLLSPKDYEHCCERAFLETNTALREEQAVNDKLSGTTAAVVCFHGGRMSVCLVGNSRVLLGHRARAVTTMVLAEDHDKKEKEEEKQEEIAEVERSDSERKCDLVAIPLTRDQTCYRRDERQRIWKMGGEIKSIDQWEGVAPMHDNWGDFIHREKVDIQRDPPRVWVPGKKYPGCTFTRSIGYSMGEGIGIIAKPEIVTYNLTSNDEILVIASDGVFEFLTNQEVIDICAFSINPLQAAELVLKAAYEKWIEHDSRCDDMTIIVCFLSSTYDPSKDDTVNKTTVALVEN